MKWNDYTCSWPLGCDHMKVYAIRYSLYAIRYALRHRWHSSDSAWKERNLVCGGEQSVVYSKYRILCDHSLSIFLAVYRKGSVIELSAVNWLSKCHFLKTSVTYACVKTMYGCRQSQSAWIGGEKLPKIVKKLRK